MSVPIQILRDGGSLNDSTAATVLFMIVSGWRAVRFFLKSTVVSGAGPRAVGTERGRWSKW